MRQITTMIIVCILLTTIATAYYAGETVIVTTVDPCNNLTINVTGTLNIDTGEYQINNCTMINQNEWFCDCKNNQFDIELTTLQTTLNNYTFNYTYWYSGEKQEIVVTPTSSNGGGSGCTPNYVCGDWQECINNTQIRLCKHEGLCSYRPKNETQDCVLEEQIDELDQEQNQDEQELEDAIIPEVTPEPKKITIKIIAIILLIFTMIAIGVTAIVYLIMNRRS